jgi:hypothetical protein
MDAMHAPHISHRHDDPDRTSLHRATAAGADASRLKDLPWKAMGAPGAKGIAPGAGPEPPDPEWQPL